MIGVCRWVVWCAVGCWWYVCCVVFLGGDLQHMMFLLFESHRAMFHGVSVSGLLNCLQGAVHICAGSAHSESSASASIFVDSVHRCWCGQQIVCPYAYCI